MKKTLFLTISEQIASDLRQAIIRRELSANDKIREMTLSKKYNVSRGPIRDALKELALEGFLTLTPNVGVTVSAPPNDKSLALILNLRRELEITVLNQIFDTLDKDDYKQLEILLIEFKNACQSDDEYQMAIQDTSFHEFFVDKLNDPHIKMIWQSLVHRQLFRYTRLPDHMASYSEHKALFDSICSKDLAQATRLLANNIQ